MGQKEDNQIFGDRNIVNRLKYIVRVWIFQEMVDKGGNEFVE